LLLLLNRCWSLSRWHSRADSGWCCSWHRWTYLLLRHWSWLLLKLLSLSINLGRRTSNRSLLLLSLSSLLILELLLSHFFLVIKSRRHARSSWTLVTRRSLIDRSRLRFWLLFLLSCSLLLLLSFALVSLFIVTPVCSDSICFVDSFFVGWL